jgi:hypothetical protein
MHAARHTVGVLHSVRFAFAFAPSRFTFDNLRDASVVLSLGGHWYELWLIEHCVVWLPGCPPPSFTFDLGVGSRWWAGARQALLAVEARLTHLVLQSATNDARAAVGLINQSADERNYSICRLGEIQSAGLGSPSLTCMETCRISCARRASSVGFSSPLRCASHKSCMCSYSSRGSLTNLWGCSGVGLDG